MALPPDGGDPVSNAVVHPEASLFLRQILKSAIEHEAATKPPPRWMAKAQALLANVMMNDLLNRWNPDCPVDPEDVQQKYVAPAMEPAAPSDPAVLALAHHAQALIHRARRNEHGQALTKFEEATGHDRGFARAHAQLGNQMIIGGDMKAGRASVQYAIDLNEHHPARGYFYWAMGRSYVQDESDWGAAVRWLCRSVNALPTVWYNRCYLAYAQHRAGKDADAGETMRKFRVELQPTDKLLEHAVSDLQGTKMGDWLKEQ
jgi:hypothetical protein